MTRVRRMLALALASAVGFTSLAIVVAPSPAQAQQGQGGNRGKNAAKKKPARRKAKQANPVGVIAPYPFPPALIIRHTSETHDEIQAFLNMLRYQ